MKRYFLTTIIVVFSIAQTFAQVNFGVKAGLNLSNEYDIGTTDNKALLRFHAGFFNKIKLSTPDWIVQ